ncbi:tRNA 2-thiouridine(34) synthase MnmA [Caldisalinibacter kiritimatiensis]|uniref:tRNA-specific 2-thiouridylase MnmA n=1 Tax=Caldisalinibacter kiritimatiensis TaxID=1304284 RepID=R1AS46_9FIRM|nr:tRNA 2-thiouridine(34) synthase MnmA [Caldisalinibacter kiritimatiensis]EOC99957.1 tRNA (5-methylaminomethyl-2-thiouridylate)-methyltransferase [Caldisalinibacter kiritimatiensis]
MDKNKVVIGMSGGVDSSVAAYLLKKQGYEVIGVTMEIYEEKNAKNDVQEISSVVSDAKKVAEKLNIPHYVVDLKDIFKEKVIDYFLHEYGRGRTPNPCIQCNKHVKFKALMQKAFDLGAYYLATGHYANVIYDKDVDRYLIKKSEADKKDQTYMLYNLTQEQLKHVLMPLGNFEDKEKVREIASELGLSVANKEESQEICFIEDDDYIRFIKENASYKIKPGHFIDTEGNILGKHKGITNYTIGQRKGLGLALGKPVYVIDILPEENVVVVGDAEKVFGKELIAEDINFISMSNLEEPMEVKAKIRYNFKEQPATIYPIEKDKVKVVFEKPVRAITPGQAVVFYKDDILVGGGTIVRKVR